MNEMAYNPKTGFYEADYEGQSDYERTGKAIQYYHQNNMTPQLTSAIGYAGQKGFNYNPSSQSYQGFNVQTGGYTKPTSSYTSTIGSAQPVMSQIPKAGAVNSQAGDQFGYLVNQENLRKTIDMAPKLAGKSNADMLGMAQVYANAEINPQMDALQKALRNALQAYENQANSIEAAYSGLQGEADEAMQRGARTATVSAANRGMGRSGAVEWGIAEAAKPINQALMQAEAQKKADLLNLANNRTLAQTNYDEGMMALERQRGELVARQLAALREREDALAIGDWERAYQAELNYTNAVNDADRWQNELMRTDAQLTGQFPGTSTTQINSPVALRDYAVSKGATVGWDANTGNVIINNKAYTPADIQANGGYMVNDRWQLPQSVIDRMLNG
jgi:hypothetical protein